VAKWLTMGAIEKFCAVGIFGNFGKFGKFGKFANVGGFRTKMAISAVAALDFRLTANKSFALFYQIPKKRYPVPRLEYE
jgi:hypothetical protein